MGVREVVAAARAWPKGVSLTQVHACTAAALSELAACFMPRRRSEGRVITGSMAAAAKI